MQYQQLLQEEELLLQQLNNIRKKKQSLRFKEEIQFSINNIETNIQNAKKERKQLEIKLSEVDDYLFQQNKEKGLLLRKLNKIENDEEVVVEEVQEAVEEVQEAVEEVQEAVEEVVVEEEEEQVEEEQTDAEFLEELKNNVLQIQEDLINQNIIYGPNQKPNMVYMKMTNSKTGGYSGSVQVGKYIADNCLPPEVYQRYLQIYKANDKSNLKSGSSYKLGAYRPYLIESFNTLIRQL